MSSIALFNIGVRGLILPVTLQASDLHLIQSIEFPSLSLAPITPLSNLIQLDSIYLSVMHIGVTPRVRMQTLAHAFINNPLGHAPLTVLSAELFLNARFVQF